MVVALPEGVIVVVVLVLELKPGAGAAKTALAGSDNE
jgi:hypothetical protein